MYAEIMQVSIAASMMVQTTVMVRNAMRAEQTQNAGAPKIAPELKIELAHAKENANVPASAESAHDTAAPEPLAGDANPVA